MTRCFGDGDPLYSQYHDDEWGIPSTDDRYLFEMLSLEGAQAGLSWALILKKREGYRAAFHNFDPKKVAKMSDSELDELCHDPSIVRNRLKIFSVRDNAQVFLKIQKEFGSFSKYIWPFVGGKPIVSQHKTFDQVPCESKESQAISKDLKKRGMRFVGPKIIYSFMQAVGMVDDHLIDCLFSSQHTHSKECRPS